MSYATSMAFINHDLCLEFSAIGGLEQALVFTLLVLRVHRVPYSYHMAQK